jgi:hypothetical protein
MRSPGSTSPMIGPDWAVRFLHDRERGILEGVDPNELAGIRAEMCIFCFIWLLCATNAFAFGLAISPGEGFGIYKKDVYRSRLMEKRMSLNTYVNMRIISPQFSCLRQTYETVDHLKIALKIPSGSFMSSPKSKFLQLIVLFFFLCIGDKISRRRKCP